MNDSVILSEAQIDSVYRMMESLSSVCDQAQSRDDQGFSKADLIGHYIPEMPKTYIEERRRWHLFRSEIPEPRTDPVVTPNTAIMVVTPRLADRIDTGISNLDREGLHHAASLINSSNSAFFARFVSHYDDANFHVRPVPRSAQEIAQCVVEVAGDFAAQIGQQSKEQVAEVVRDVMDPRQCKRTSNDCQGTVAGLTLTYNHSSATLTLFDRDEDEEEQLVSAFVFNQRFVLR